MGKESEKHIYKVEQLCVHLKLTQHKLVILQYKKKMQKTPDTC